MELAKIIAIIAVAFPIVCVIVCYITAQVGPWSTLAKLYPHDESVVGTSHRFVSLSMGFLSYSNCLTAVANGDQLTLRVIPPLRPFHPPLTIPRAAVSRVTHGQFIWMPSVKFHVADYKLQLFGTVATSTFWQSDSEEEPLD